MHPLSLRTVTAVLLCTGLLFGSAIGHAKDDTTPLTVDASFNPASAAEKGFVIAEGRALKGIKRVAVPVFAVEFIIADNVNSQTSGFGAAGRSSSLHRLPYRRLSLSTELPRVTSLSAWPVASTGEAASYLLCSG